MSFKCLIGDRLVADIRFPRPGEVDIAFLEQRMHSIRRFSGNPKALTVFEHLQLVGRLAEAEGLSPSAVLWAYRHDFHEYALGDNVGPLKSALGAPLLAIERRWDEAIYAALGDAPPTAADRLAVKPLDTLALSLEWHLCLEREDAQPFSRPCSDQAVDILAGVVGAHRVMPSHYAADSPEVADVEVLEAHDV
jgi:hypothetical protein